MAEHINILYLYNVSFKGICQSIHLTIYHGHPFIISIDPYINIARHMSALTVYSMESQLNTFHW